MQAGRSLGLGLGLVLSALVISGCGASTSEDDVVDEESEALTSGYTFHCREAHRTNGPELYSIRLTKTRAKLVAVDPNLAGVNASYIYNPNYAPRAASHQGFAQYGWDDGAGHKMVLLFGPGMRTGGAALAGGGHGGDVTLEGPRISHAIQSLFCTR